MGDLDALGKGAPLKGTPKGTIGAPLKGTIRVLLV